TNVPRQDGFIASKTDLTIGKALAHVHIGAAGFDVITRNFCLCKLNAPNRKTHGASPEQNLGSHICNLIKILSLPQSRRNSQSAAHLKRPRSFTVLCLSFAVHSFSVR